MPKDNKPKKRVVVSFNNLPQELQDAVKAKYPTGFTESMIRIEKGPADFFYAVVYETDDISYLVKITVNVDKISEEEEEKEYYNDDMKGSEEIADSNDEPDDE